MAMRRRALLTGLFALATGCARADWIGSTLVTVDVSGDWRGTYARGIYRGSIVMKLEQQGARVTGTFEFSMPSGAAGRVAGTVSGDKLRLEGPGLLSGDLTIGVDEMTGLLAPPAASYPGGRLSVLLLRQ